MLYLIWVSGRIFKSIVNVALSNDGFADESFIASIVW